MAFVQLCGPVRIGRGLILRRLASVLDEPGALALPRGACAFDPTWEAPFTGAAAGHPHGSSFPEDGRPTMRSRPAQPERK